MEDHLDQNFVVNNLQEYACRYVYRLTSFMTFRLMASKIADMGFSYNTLHNCVKCVFCNFEISVGDNFIEDCIKIHRAESHGEVEDLPEPELKIERRGRTKTESFRIFANHLEASDQKQDARMVKAYLDSPKSIFLMGKGYSRTAIKIAVIMLLLSNKGTDPSNTSDMVDALESLCGADIEVLGPEFDKLLFVPPVKVVVQSTASVPPVASSSTATSSSSKMSLSNILKHFPNPFGSSFDQAVKARTDKSRRHRKAKKLEHSIAEETLKKIDYNASGLSLMLAGSGIELT